MIAKAENYRERHSRVQIYLRRIIMKFMKKRKIRRIASLFMAVLMVAALMPGSITNTKADDKTAESGVVVDAGTWENNERTTTWDFSKYSGSSSLTLAEGDEVGRIKVAAGKAYVRLVEQDYQLRKQRMLLLLFLLTQQQHQLHLL